MRCSCDMTASHGRLVACGRRLPRSAGECARCAASHAQSVAEFYKGKTIEVYIGTSVGGGYDAYTRILSRHMGRYIPGNPMRRAEEHGGRRRHPARQFPLQRRAQGRPGVRHLQPRHRLRAAARQQGGAVRRHQVQLDRLHQRRSLDLRRLAHDRRRALPAGAGAGAGGRRVGHRRRHLPVSQDRQRRARHQVQDRHRLSRRQRHRPRHGAPGGAGPLRLVVVEREGHASDLAAGEEVQHRCSRWGCPSIPSCRTCR